MKILGEVLTKSKNPKKGDRKRQIQPYCWMSVSLIETHDRS